MKLPRLTALMLAILLLLTALASCTDLNEGPEPENEPSEQANEDDTMNDTDGLTPIEDNAIKDAAVNPRYQAISIDGTMANTNAASSYRGLGAVTGNNSSRLLMDYKADNPAQYWEIMNYLFKKDYAAGLTYLKIEFGTDVNSSSGTEPSTMRTADETANVRRGAGFMFAADALSINPDITVDLLRWGEPKWVTDAFSESQETGHQARYKWYKETIDAAYDEFGIVFSYISADANEQDKIDVDWLIYFSERLKNEAGAGYDYGNIKIVASDEVGSWKIADEMVGNERLRDAVDVLAVHYNTWSSDNAKALSDDYGKELWYSEGISPIVMASLFADANGSGINGVNGSLDVCNRIINSYYRGHMTLYAYQPAVAAYYSGAKFYPKALIYANEPWAGHYTLEAGVWVSAHFTMFIEQGWQFIDSACFGDGKENHSITETTNNYMTLASPESGDYTAVICNDSPEQRNYTFTVSNLAKASSPFTVWETTGPLSETDAYNTNYLKATGRYRPADNGDGTYSYSVEVRPYSIITLTTLDKEAAVPVPARHESSAKPEVLSLPYTDAFDYDAGFLKERGAAPKYTTDQGGAFEVREVDGNHVLMQVIDASVKPTDWRFRGTPKPITSLGDDRWSNYAASVDFQFDKNGNDSNYAGFGVRYLSSEIDSGSAESGYSLRVYQNGAWELRAHAKAVEKGEIASFDRSQWHSIKITAIDRQITAELNGEIIAEYCDEIMYANSGRVSISSDYFNNVFDNLKAEPVDGMAYAVTRIDDHDPSIRYIGAWDNAAAVGYNEFNRTTSIADGKDTSSASFTFGFTGTEFAFIGPNGAAVIEMEVDGVKSIEQIAPVKSRQTFYKRTGLDHGAHTVTVTVTDGKFVLDAIEVA